MGVIKRLRIKANISQVELAERMNVTQSAISQWETGDSLPSADKLLQLAKILDCTADELLNKNVE